MGDLFYMDNAYADVRPRTRREEVQIQELEQSNKSAREHNNSKANEKVITGTIKRYCGLCEAQLIKTKKSDKIEELEIEVPRFKCKTCGQVYSGFGLELFTSNKKVKAICFEYDGTI